MKMQIGAILAASIVVFSTEAFAGQGNILRVLQTSPSGSVSGNSLSVDQSEANESLLIGPSDATIQALSGKTLTIDHLERATFDPGWSALQNGEKNTAKVVIEGNGGQLQLLQDNMLPNNSEAVGSKGNSAVAELAAGALGGVFQLGDGNTAKLKVDPLGKGLIAQNGNGNFADLEVLGGGKGQIVQNGNRNNQPLTVTSNTTVMVTQNGNGLQPVGTAGIQVFSTNPGTISITQTGFR
ncbi:hypothetical protein KEU06_22995 [Pseudaminobacter sp. 19-2017]|uniref:Curlin associated repeat-containing protein n=1 Tax=Pseudaminobacter soli (ex Zhang et al. 2022) TaxID=2831468 RepID=A0A942E5G4_9HYPH|nr:hypothetical protein [Pseudaminobacter soli]MBS3651488.1 hypothetical protein [Pseudaminobacter soli]